MPLKVTAEPFNQATPRPGPKPGRGFLSVGPANRRGIYLGTVEGYYVRAGAGLTELTGQEGPLLYVRSKIATQDGKAAAVSAAS